MQNIRVLLLLIVMLFYGCLCSQIASFEEYTNGWIGQPVKDLREVILRPTSYASRIGWKETTYDLNNGNWVYVQPDRKGCLIHWEINPRGIIVGYKTEGERCQ